MTNVFSLTHINDLLTMAWLFAALTLAYRNRVRPWVCALLFAACLAGGLGAILLQEAVYPNFGVYMLLFIVWGCVYGAAALKGSFLWKMAMSAVYGCITFHLGKAAALVNSFLPASIAAQRSTGFIFFQVFALLSAVFLAYRAVTTERKVPAICWSSLMLVSLIGVGFAYYQMAIVGGKETLLTSALYSMGMVVIVLLVQNLCAQVIWSHERNLVRLSLEQNSESEALMARQASRAEEELRRYRHETANHLLTISSLLSNGDTEQARQLISEIVVTPASQAGITSGNPLVDAVISQKKAQCQDMGISFSADLVLKEKLPLTDAEVSSLLGNLLNNAVEAAASREHPFVRMRMYPARDYLCVEVVNSADTARLRGNPTLSTTKAEPELHGIGLRVVREIADRHQGMTSFDCSREGEFTARVMIHL